MLFKIQELKHFLLSIHKQQIESIDIRSKNLNLSINTVAQENRYINHGNPKFPVLQKKTVKAKLKVNTVKPVQPIKQEQGLYFTIVSPMIGTFYRSPAPHEKAFISVNDTVEVNQTVCIIEAMKLMNEIESEVNGSIAEILVEDGDIVDCGQALMRVKKK